VAGWDMTLSPAVLLLISLGTQQLFGSAEAQVQSIAAHRWSTRASLRTNLLNPYDLAFFPFSYLNPQATPCSTGFKFGFSMSTKRDTVQHGPTVPLSRISHAGSR
jgi:hypothetical protein